jgi:hypothetical protein
MDRQPHQVVKIGRKKIDGAGFFFPEKMMNVLLQKTKMRRGYKKAEKKTLSYFPFEEKFFSLSRSPSLVCEKCFSRKNSNFLPRKMAET